MPCICLMGPIPFFYVSSVWTRLKCAPHDIFSMWFRSRVVHRGTSGMFALDSKCFELARHMTVGI